MSESRPRKRKVEFIESYWTGGEIGSDYQWNDNHGELIRCRNCVHGQTVIDAMTQETYVWCKYRCTNRQLDPDWFCADGVKKDKEK